MATFLLPKLEARGNSSLVFTLRIYQGLQEVKLTKVWRKSLSLNALWGFYFSNLFALDLQKFINYKLGIPAPNWFSWRLLFLGFCSYKLSFPVSAYWGGGVKEGLLCDLHSLMNHRILIFSSLTFLLCDWEWWPFSSLHGGLQTTRKVFLNWFPSSQLRQ